MIFFPATGNSVCRCHPQARQWSNKAKLTVRVITHIPNPAHTMIGLCYLINRILTPATSISAEIFQEPLPSSSDKPRHVLHLCTVPSESSVANHLSVKRVLTQILLLGILVMVWQQVQYCPQLHVSQWYHVPHGSMVFPHTSHLISVLAKENGETMSSVSPNLQEWLPNLGMVKNCSKN